MEFIELEEYRAYLAILDAKIDELHNKGYEDRMSTDGKIEIFKPELDQILVSAISILKSFKRLKVYPK